MALAAWQATIVDEAGNIQANAAIEVLREIAGQPPAQCYSDRAGSTPIGSTFNADAEGFVRFHAAGGAYQITATLGAFSRVWRYQAIGTAAETDAGLIPTSISTGWRFATSTTDSDPGSGLFRLNHGTPASATAIYLDNENAGANIVTAWLDSLDDSGESSDRGLLTICDPDQPTEVFHIYRVSGSVVDGTGYRKLTVAHVSGAGAFTAATLYSITFAARGPEVQNMQRRFCVHVEDHGAVGFSLDDINEANGFTAVVDDTAAFEAAIEAAIDAGHRRVVWNKCHAVNLIYDSAANDRYRGLELIGPGASNWREPMTGIITPFDINLPAMQFGDETDPGGGRFYGLVTHGFQTDDLRYEDGEENIITRGGKTGLKLVGSIEHKHYNPFFGGLAEKALHLLGGDGSFFNHFFGTRFTLQGPENAESLYADQGANFITTTWFHGVTFDEPSSAESGHVALHMIGRNVGLTMFGAWLQLEGAIIKIEETSSGLGGGDLTGYDCTLEAPEAGIEIDLRVEGGGAFRTNVHDHIKGTWNFTGDVEIEPTANGYTGGDPVATMSGSDVTEMPTLLTQSRRGHQRLLANAADPQWLLSQEPMSWLDISQDTVLEPAEIVKAERYTLFVRALTADRAFSLGDGSGVTTHVSGFSGTVQAGTVTRFDCYAALIPGGDVVLFAHATERYLGASQSKLWKALASGAAGANQNTVQPWFPTAGSLTVQATTTYRFSGRFHSTRAAGNTNHTTSILFGGTATLTSIAYTAKVKTGDAAGLAADSQVESAVATATQIKAASTSTTEVISFLIEGIVRINAAGTFIPQFIYSAAPGGAPTIAANTYFEMEAIGSNTAVSVGPWA